MNASTQSSDDLSDDSVDRNKYRAKKMIKMIVNEAFKVENKKKLANKRKNPQ
jgi:hypothetical protein